MLTYRVITENNVIAYQGTNLNRAINIGEKIEEYADIECRDVDSCGHYGHSKWQWRKSVEELVYANEP